MGPERGERRGGRRGRRPAARAASPRRGVGRRRRRRAGGGGLGRPAAEGRRSRSSRASERARAAAIGEEAPRGGKGRQPGGDVSHLLLPLAGTASSALPSAGVPGRGGAPAPCRGSARPERAGDAAGAVRRVRRARGGRGRGTDAPRTLLAPGDAARPDGGAAAELRAAPRARGGSGEPRRGRTAARCRRTGGRTPEAPSSRWGSADPGASLVPARRSVRHRSAAAGIDSGGSRCCGQRCSAERWHPAPGGGCRTPRRWALAGFCLTFGGGEEVGGEVSRRKGASAVNFTRGLSCETFIWSETLQSDRRGFCYVGIFLFQRRLHPSFGSTPGWGMYRALAGESSLPWLQFD